MASTRPHEDPGYTFDPDPSPEQAAHQIAFRARELGADGALTLELQAQLSAELEETLHRVHPNDAETIRRIFARAQVTDRRASAAP